MADQGSEGCLSPYLRRKRMQAVTPWLKGRVLDFGCGTGLLASLVGVDEYLGIERDKVSLQQAKNTFPKHQFIDALPQKEEKFNTVVALAVIEHIKDPINFLVSLSEFLEDNHVSRIIVTTPHPSVDWVHSWGAKVGLFSRHANDEHEELFGHQQLVSLGEKANLNLKYYSRFLFGANQIAAYSKRDL